ncbi:hypothetical protein [Hymenobacter sp. 5414T-23]|uniref:hypothetical protein n=1 Tax=Hymenobacter sp. 5414T-23 TaxID=2932252 RepID=UPI001FD5FB46|nr:hypothetical protein [Hymenobacter sp. 5414T-23]UOQ83222.1 hypothetical protein MUN83_01990 [Hymenobacter sp. 5414T-23]
MQAALITPTQAGLVYAADLLMLLLRYGLFAGVAYWVFWRWKKARWQHRRIQPRFPEAKHIRTEIRYSILTCLIFAAVGVCIFAARQAGYTRIYTSIGQYGWPYVGVVPSLPFSPTTRISTGPTDLCTCRAYTIMFTGYTTCPRIHPRGLRLPFTP